MAEASQRSQRPGHAVALQPATALPPDWPHRAHSHAVVAGGLRWHVQLFGTPGAAAGSVLLLHGTGASSHSFAGLAPLLAARHRVIVPDLPGHAHTQRPRAEGLSLPGMAEGLGALLRVLGEAPVLVVGHSAGAAIGARLCLDGHANPRVLASINGAFFPPRGLGQGWFAPAAKLLALNPLVPHVFAWQAARPATLKKLIDSTGSAISPESVALYGRLVGDPAHVAAVLAMMALWDLPPLLRDLPALRPRLALLVGACDTTVPPAQAEELRRLVPAAAVQVVPGRGHLVHEESPRAVAEWLLALADAGVTGRPQAVTPD